MRKLLVSLIVVSVLVCGWVTAGAANEAEVLTLSFAAAATRAVEHNLDLQLTRLSLANAQKSYERAVIVGDADEIEVAAEALEKATADFNTAQTNLVLDVERLYRDLLSAEQRLLEQEETLAEAQRRYDLDKTRYEVGLIAAIDLEKAANTFFSATNSYNSQMSTTQTTRLRFNELLGLPLATVVALEGEIAAVFTPLEMTLSSAIATATVHSTAYKQAQEALATADAAVLAASSEFTPVAEYEKTLYEQQRAQINLAKAEQKLYFDVRSALITVQQRESTVELRQRELSVAQTNLKAAEVQFKAGAMSSETLQERTDALRAAQDAVTSAIWDHTSARRDFLNLIGTPEPVLQVLTDEK